MKEFEITYSGIASPLVCGQTGVFTPTFFIRQFTCSHLNGGRSGDTVINNCALWLA
jgi:hypothetical protein